MKIPDWLRYKKGENERSPVYFIDTRGTDFHPGSPLWKVRINHLIQEVLEEIHAPEWKEPVLVKCHIGEKRCRTRMLPDYCLSTVRHFRSMGMKRIVTGDTTVAYDGERGYHNNHGKCIPYMKLAGKHGWTEKGPLGTPFVILDRPKTSIDGLLSFNDEEIKFNPKTTKHFRDIYLSGGFAAAGTIINHLHLTLHDMAQVACAVKGLTMGGSSYKGKLIMHKCYKPLIDDDLCEKCGICARKCPENSWDWEKDAIPVLEGEKCIGCGECMAVCPSGSISMASDEIEDWSRGEETLPYRMSDYIMGMMEGRWDRLLNIVHLYNITRRCDCLDRAQKPVVPHIGFLIGRNPFAVDRLATGLLQEEFYNHHNSGLDHLFSDFHGSRPYEYIQREYGVVVEHELINVEKTCKR